MYKPHAQCRDADWAKEVKKKKRTTLNAACQADLSARHMLDISDAGCSHMALSFNRNCEVQQYKDGK